MSDDKKKKEEDIIESDDTPCAPVIDPLVLREFHQERLCRDISTISYVVDTLNRLKLQPENEYLIPDIDRQIAYGLDVINRKKTELVDYCDA